MSILRDLIAEAALFLEEHYNWNIGAYGDRTKVPEEFLNIIEEFIAPVVDVDKYVNVLKARAKALEMSIKNLEDEKTELKDTIAKLERHTV